MDTNIDFVVTWVDGSDPLWLAEKQRYQPGQRVDASAERYRDWDNLRYWFRGVERFAPWVNRIHFVTWGHVPDWLNVSHPKLHIVKHEDYIPKEYLPTFNSHPIELNMHRIEGLQERFVYFNDDVFCIRSVSPGDFFKHGKPRDLLAFQPVVANRENPVMSYIYLNNTMVLAKYFDKRREVRRHPLSYFKPGYPPLYFFYNLLELAFPRYTGFYTPHGPAPFLKRTFVELWEREGELLHRTSSHRFRGTDDVSPYLVREWQKLTGNFAPANVLKDFRYFNVESDNPKLINTITGQRAKVICINDATKEIDFEHAKRQIADAFERILPGHCEFEL